MAREKPDWWGCEHCLPIEVVPFGDGHRARCLSCGESGPVHPDVDGALRALQDLASRREKKIGV